MQSIIKRCQKLMDRGYGLEYCLKRFSSHEREIRDYFSLVENLKQLRKVGPTKEFKKNSLDSIIARAESRGGLEASRAYEPSIPRRRLLLKPAMVFTALIILSLFSFAGTLFASQDSLPGETLYPLKRSFEEFRILIYPEGLKGGLHLRFLNNRLEEAEILLAMDDGIDPEIMEDLISEMERQYKSCKQYNSISPDSEEELLESIDSVKSRYRNRFGKDINNGSGVQEGTEKNGKDNTRGTDSRDNNQNDKGKGDSRGNGK